MAEAALAAGANARFKAAHATGEDWGRIAKACVDELGVLPEGANLGVVYATDALADDLGSILTFLRERTRVEDWIGTVGFGVSSTGVEYHDQPGLAVLVGALPPDGYRIVSGLNDATSGLPVETQAWSDAHGPVFGVVHGDPGNEDIVEMIGALSDTTTGFLVGGLAASRGEMPQVAGRITNGGLSGVLFGRDVPVTVGLSQGCTPIGPVREITLAEQNVIMEIDGRPALEVFKEEIGEILARDLRRVGGYIYAAFPITGSDTGDYLVRNLVGIDTERDWIAVGEAVSHGMPVMFCRRDHDSAEQDLQRMLADVKRRAGDGPKAGLYFSCVARGEHLFGSNSEELKLVQETLGDFPLVGFFANGEISHNRLYGYTGVLALFL